MNAGWWQLVWHGQEATRRSGAGARREAGRCPHPSTSAPSSRPGLRVRQEARSSVPVGAAQPHARPELPDEEVPAAVASRGQHRGGGRGGIPDPAGDGLLSDRQRAAGGEPVGGACGDRRLCRAGQLAHPVLRPRVHDRPDDRRGDRPAGRAEPRPRRRLECRPRAHRRGVGPARSAAAGGDHRRALVHPAARRLPGRRRRTDGRRPARQGDRDLLRGRHDHRGAARFPRRRDGHRLADAHRRREHAGGHPAAALAGARRCPARSSRWCWPRWHRSCSTWSHTGWRWSARSRRGCPCRICPT